MELSPEKAGFSSERLKNLDAYLQRIVDTEEVAGASAYLLRKDTPAYLNCAGWQDRESDVPMAHDTIHRIFSMTKTFTAATLMTLYEKGLFKLDDPISEYLPAFKNMKVAEHDARGTMRIVSAKSEITFAQLCTMTSGMPYDGNDSYSAREMLRISEKLAKHNKTGTPKTTIETVSEAAAVPLCFHPGERWMYGFSHDVLGALIEVISGKRFGDYMKEVILDPLGLMDTAFYVPEEKRSRLASCYFKAGKTLKPANERHVDTVPFAPPAFESGGAGLCSTLHDVGRFAQMYLQDGKLDGHRVLSRKTVELISRNHLTPGQLEDFHRWTHMKGYGYGLCVRTMLDTAASGTNGTYGEWAWDGKLGTWYFIDPVEDMLGVFLIQRIPGGNENLPKRFMQIVYGAIDD